jgi:hypothetical protein
MSAFECYKEYLSLKNHFSNPTYDYFRYNGKSKASATTFETRKDKLYFQKLAKHPDPKNFIMSNLLENNRLWIKEIAYSETANKVYTEWLKRQQSLIYLFTQEINYLKEDFNSNFIIKNNEHPYCIKLFLRKELSLESLIILVDLAKCMKYWSKKLEYDPSYSEISTKIIKYRPFLNYDKEKVKKIVIDKFNQSQ